MNRRNFLRSMLGVAAATALPSEVWPFRKIFLPPAGTCWSGTQILRPPLDITAIEAVELEFYKKELPDLIFRENLRYTRLKNRAEEFLTTGATQWRVPKELNDALVP